MQTKIQLTGAVDVNFKSDYLALVTLGVALWLRGRRAYGGQVFFAAMAVFVVGRALLDPLRHDDAG